ncbi:MAG: sodium:alanine symporter family protein [Clostridia bacterium]|nr:sodium:alanine symporter family protein [Clostridia bacterium]
MEWLNGVLLGRLVPVLLLGAGLFYGGRLGFFHLLRPHKVLRELTEKGQGGENSPLRAMSLALAGTLGVGNLVGVASAICLGGAGAVFWMWVSAFCAMLLKYAEIVLAMTHRRRKDAGWHGSAMLYIRDYFTQRKRPVLAVLLSGLFALLCALNSLSMGSMIQIHAVSEAMEGVVGVSPLLVGSVLAVVVFFLLRGGTQRILRLSAKLVPFMTLGYLLLSLAALILRREVIPSVLGRIFTDAFSGEAAAGGIGGFLLGKGVRYGTMRGLLSNEAGCGTAPMAHATTDGTDPVRQGIWGIFEVFADTILLCTLTALVILTSGVTLEGEDYMMITISAYAEVLGEFAAYFLAGAVLLFGFATVVCWGHYGRESVAYLSPSPRVCFGFQLTYAASILAGAVFTSREIWQIADLAIGLMTLINVPILCAMSGEVCRATKCFLSTGKKERKRKRN